MTHTVSIWEKEGWLGKVDVLVAGGGLLGLWTAYELIKRKPGTRILLLEQSAIPMGASTRNAGFACFGSPTELMHDAAIIGVDAMLEIVEMRFRGIRKILSVLGEASVEYDPVGGFECVDKLPDNFDDRLQQLNAWLAPIMNTSETFSDASHKMKDFGLQGFEAMYENNMEGGVHSGHLVHALAKLVQQMGVTVLYGVGVDEWEQVKGAVVVRTKDGNALLAKKLVLATNAFLSGQLKELNIMPARGQVLLTKPIEGLALKGTFHFDEGFYYWRNLGNRILLGGARNKDFKGEQTIDFATTAIIQNALEAFLMQHMPAVFNDRNMEEMIEMRWSGIMAMSANKKPVLKEIEKGVWAAMSCNGMGVALSPVFAEVVAHAVLTS
jgi:gamma-glutamylputrescine oxidase